MPDDPHDPDAAELDPTDLSETHTAPRGSTSGEQIGPYRLLEKLGEGGMGEVWLADQQEPVKRKVALKVIKQGMDTKQVVARFEAERQALALMDHPCIAKVYDAGATPRGRPYFVMEHVKGVPITEYCDRHRLTAEERLKLFMEVCEGVQHAHQNAIIHRDIKPTNVLVATQHDRRMAKIIDFGVAKATAQRLTERTVFTELGQLIGTPEYMSPEQAEMTAENVDTRTDVYSLGVLLYELLVGALPLDSKELRKAGFDEIRRRIREDEPSRPSTRVSSLGEASTDSARKRRTDPASLTRRLRGDLDWITMKALEKDRTRRYGSPNELAADIGRHLRREPVLAGPPTAAYRAGKFVRRHRIGVAVAVAAFLLVVGFAVRERIQAKRIAREAATAEQVSEFLVGLFEVSDPSEARGNSITAREILDKGAEEIGATLADQPEVQARLMETIGRVYWSLGLYSRAEPLFEQSLETARLRFGDDHPDTLSAMHNLATVHMSRARYDEAEPLYLESLESRRRVLGDDHPDTLSSANNLANLYFNQRRYDRAEPLYLETLAARKRRLGGNHPKTLSSMNNLAGLYLHRGRHDEAERLYLEALDTQSRLLGDDHPDVLSSMNNLANLYNRQGRYDEAEPLYRRALETQSRVLGNEHPTTLSTTDNLANLYFNQDRLEEARLLYLEILEARKRLHGGRHPETAGTFYNLACLDAVRGDPKSAKDWLRRSVEAGWTDADSMAHDSDLESLHGEEFEALVERVRRNAEEPRD